MLVLVAAKVGTQPKHRKSPARKVTSTVRTGGGHDNTMLVSQSSTMDEHCSIAIASCCLPALAKPSKPADLDPDQTIRNVPQ
jgi:hypothetical protein